MLNVTAHWIEETQYFICQTILPGKGIPLLTGGSSKEEVKENLTQAFIHYGFNSKFDIEYRSLVGDLT